VAGMMHLKPQPMFKASESEKAPLNMNFSAAGS
jgi:hypothetical protein